MPTALFNWSHVLGQYGEPFRLKAIQRRTIFVLRDAAEASQANSWSMAVVTLDLDLIVNIDI